MAYETSLISETPSAIPTAPQPIMREERVIDPYARPTRAVSRETIAPTGQNVISGEKVLAEVPATPAETVQLSPQMAALARKEQRFRREQQDLKTEKAQIEAERKEFAELRAFKAKLEAKDFSEIEDRVPYDDYTNYLIEKTEKQSPEALALKKLSEEVENVKKTQKENVEKQFEAAVNERRKAVNQLVDGSEEFSSIKELKLQEAVVKHILDTWEQDNIELSPEEAAKEVEKELNERAAKWAALTKLRAKEEAPIDGDKKQLPPLKTAIKTLTNNMAATGEIKRPNKPFHMMSDSERYAEARRRAEEKLKQGR